MPSTAAGTAYTITTTTSTGYGTCLLMVADAHAADANIPTIVYMHGAGGAYNQFASTAAWKPFLDHLIDQGFAVIEGGGGITDSAGAQNWANANARLEYVAYVLWAAGIIDIGPIVPFGRSMGGPLSVWMYLLSSIASQCVGLIVSSGVQTFSYGTLSSVILNPDLPPDHPDQANYPARQDNRPSAHYFGSAFQNAYGVSSTADAITASHDHDPMNFDPTLWDGKKVLQLVGTDDHVVPPQTRGAYPLRSLYAGRPGIDLLDTKVDGTHDTITGSYDRVAPMTSFLADLGLGK